MRPAHPSDARYGDPAMSPTCLLSAPERMSRIAGQRRQLLRQASGRVLDVSIGGALHRHAFHPARVQSITLADRGLPSAVSDGSYDTVVCSLTLCCSDEPDDALRHWASFLAPEGQLLLFEHVRPAALCFQGRSRGGATCRLDVQALDITRSAGLVVTDCLRLHAQVGPLARLPLVAAVVRPRPATSLPADQERLVLEGTHGR